MQNRFFGDEHDYVKYGLLRCFAQGGMKTGICWMLNPDGIKGGDKIDYLNDSNRWRTHDPVLFDFLKKTRKIQGKKDIRSIESGAIIPGATFLWELVPDTKLHRVRWFQLALRGLAGADLIFFDPDNGIDRTDKKVSTKHVYWSELIDAFQSGFSILVFQCVPLYSNRSQFTAELVNEVKAYIAGATVETLSSKGVLFLVAYHAKHAPKIRTSLNAIRKSWAPVVH